MRDPQRKVDTVKHMLAYLHGKKEKNSFVLAEINALEWAIPILEKHLTQEKAIINAQLKEVRRRA